MAEWWEEEGAFAKEEEAVAPWWEEEGAIEGEAVVKKEAPRYFTDPLLTPERIAGMGELTDISKMLEGRDEGALTDIGDRVSQALLNMTTTDPMELANILTSRFPKDIEVSLSPEGVPVARNKHTGYEVAINKPGFSAMDVLQGIGLIGAYTPAGRLTGAVKGVAGRIATAMFGAGATEAVLQVGQAEAGGEFDESDIALSGALGPAPEVLGKPLVAAATKAKELVKPLAKTIPANITQALEFAKKQGRKITTADALKEYITFPMQLFLKISERIPITGTGKIAVKQQAQRADTLSQIAKEFDINIETEFGEEIVESFVSRMLKKRFWGKNKNPNVEQVRAAFQREGDEVTDNLLSRYIRRGDIDEEIVDKALDSGNTKRIQQLFGRLDEGGQAAAKQRFVARGLEKAGWTPEGAQIADPTKFVKYLDQPNSRKAVRAMFSDADQELLSGAREYLRLTSEAGQIKGAGMTAAMAAGAGIWLFDIFSAAIGGAVTGLSARTLQSAPVRNLFLRLAHAKGDEAVTAAVMRELRPLTLAMGNQYLQGEKLIDLDVEITKDMVKETQGEVMGYLRGLGESGTAEDASQRLEEMLQ